MRKECRFVLDEKENDIKERKITVKLSDADCDRLAKKCGEHGLTVGELIENFIEDLVGSTYSNGSDERDYAERWFERCWFGMFPEQTLLNHLLCWGYEPEDYLDILDNIEGIKDDIKNIEKNIENPDNRWKDIVTRRYINDDNYIEIPCYKSVEEYIAVEKEFLETYKEEKSMQEEMIKDMIEDWKPEKEPNMDEEIKFMKKWIKEREVWKMKISRAKTIAEYKEIRAEKIQKWIDDNFVKGSVEWEMNGASAIKVTDRTGNSMMVQLAVID